MGLDRAAFLCRAAGAAAGAAALGAVPALAPPRRPPLGDLARRTRGALVTPGHPAYAAARGVVNVRFAGARPVAVLRARDVADVREAVLWCARNSVPIAVRSGGHSYAGYSTRTGGLVLDLAALNGLRVAPGARTAEVGAGGRLIDLCTGLAGRGLAVPAGSCPTVGIGGLALGGGVGLASRALGTTSDNVVALTIVTADGRALGCDARRNADLFWACRGGGGGSFGVVTGLTFRTHRVRTASWFQAAFDWDDAAEVVAAWQRWAPGAPDELFSICTLSTGAPAPTVGVLGQYLGPEPALRRLLRRLTAAVPALRLRAGTSGYLELQRRWAGCLGESPDACRRPPRDRFGAKSDYVRRPLSGRAVATLVRGIELRQARPSDGSGAVLLDPYGGAINRVAPEATAFVHRDALFSIQYLAYWGSAGGEAPGLAWLRGLHRRMRPFVSGFAYQNYIDPELASWPRAYYGANLERLIEVKAASDPDDLFRFRQSIPVR